MEKLLKEQNRTNKLLEVISDQLELQYLEQFVDDVDPDPMRLMERDNMRTKVFLKRQALNLESK